MKMPIAEVLDRYSILTLKVERTDDPIEEEIEAYAQAFGEWLEEHPNPEDEKYMQDHVTLLVEVNGKIWDLESDIRRGKEGELGLEEVGRRALAIRDLNKERIELKNKVADHCNEGFREKKSNHASQ